MCLIFTLVYFIIKKIANNNFNNFLDIVRNEEYFVIGLELRVIYSVCYIEDFIRKNSD